MHGSSTSGSTMQQPAVHVVSAMWHLYLHISEHLGKKQPLTDGNRWGARKCAVIVLCKERLIVPVCRVQLQVAHVPGHCIMSREGATVPRHAMRTAWAALHRGLGICLWRVLLVHGGCSLGG